MARLRLAADAITAAVPGARTAADQSYRQTTWAMSVAPEGMDREGAIARVVAGWREARANVTVNSLWVLGWYGTFDKLAMAKAMMAEVFSVEIDANRQHVLYVGDSLNDQPMFDFFPHSVGVSTIASWLDQLTSHPNWVTRGPGGSGFVEVADAILSAR